MTNRIAASGLLKNILQMTATSVHLLASKRKTTFVTVLNNLKRSWSYFLLSLTLSFSKTHQNQSPRHSDNILDTSARGLQKRQSTAVEHISSTKHLPLCHYIDIHTYTAPQTLVIKKLSITETKTNISGGICGLHHFLKMPPYAQGRKGGNRWLSCFVFMLLSYLHNFMLWVNILIQTRWLTIEADGGLCFTL